MNKSDEPLLCVIVGIGVGIGVGLFLGFSIVGNWPRGTKPYLQGVLDTQKKAYANGLMEKEITKDDKVIYRWKHLEKIGYEDN